jgi:hypothetical protein
MRREWRDPRHQSAIALFIIDEVCRSGSVLRAALTTSDLFCLRLTCREAWGRVPHAAIHRLNLYSVAAQDGHLALAWWGHTAGIPLTTGNRQQLARIGVDPGYLTGPGATWTDLAAVVDGLLLGGHWKHVRSVLMLWPGRTDVPPSVWDAIARVGSVSLATSVAPDPHHWAPHVVAVAESGSVPLMQWLWAGTPLSRTSQVTVAAASSGSVPLLTWLSQREWPLVGRATAAAAAAGHLSALRWLVANGCPVVPTTLRVAVQGGHVNVVRWLASLGMTVDRFVLYHAAEVGHGPTVQWLLDHVDSYDSHQLTHAAAASPSPLAFTFLTGHLRLPYDAVSCAAAARATGSLATLTHIATSAPLSVPFLADEALARGDLDVLLFAAKLGQKATSEGAREILPRPGGVSLVRFALARELFVDPDTIRNMVGG